MRKFGRKFKLKALVGAGAMLVAAAALHAPGASAEERIAYKSAKSGTSYYQMGVELANAVKAGTDGDVILTVEESQGSVQNVMEAAARAGNYVFTAPPALVSAAAAGKGPFKERPNPRFSEIRSLFPIPSLTMHFVMRGDSGAHALSDLAGKTILLGKGSFGATEGEKYLDMFGLKDKVTVADAELGNAADALKNGQIDGFVTAGSFPAPNVIEASASTPVGLVTMTDEQVDEDRPHAAGDPRRHLCRRRRGRRDDLAAGLRLHHHGDERRDGLSPDQDLLGGEGGARRGVAAGGTPSCPSFSRTDR